MKDVSISVVIPAYNCEATIVDAVTSVVEQSVYRENIKDIVVVSDGSTDGTMQILQRLANTVENLKVFETQNSGPSAARNVGISRATGEWIAFLDADDSWRPQKLEQQLRVLDKYPDASFCSCSSNKISGPYGRHINDRLYEVSLFTYLLRSRISTPTVLVKKASLMASGLFDERSRFAEDENLFMKIIATEKSYHLDVVLVDLFDKPVYGSSGLSANLKAMHEGRLSNIREAINLGVMSILAGQLLIGIERIKYARRLLVTKTHTVRR